MAITGQGMPPYSLDPRLSHERHADPEYINSSDMTEVHEPSSMDVTLHSVLPSSPPKRDSLYLDSEMRGDEDDESTDDDEAPDSTRRIVSGRAYSESTLRPGSFKLAIHSDSYSRYSPEAIVATVFDNEMFSDIVLDNRGLRSIPEACRDLIDHEDLGNRTFKLDLTGNNILNLNKFTYDIRRLEYLSLRLNRLNELSPLVGQLEKLQELHVGNNNLRTLPAEILDLPSLRTLTTYPNDFIPVPKDSQERLFVMNPVPSLVEMARRTIAQAGYSQRFTDFERQIRQLISESADLFLSRHLDSILEAVYIGRVCSVCSVPVIEPHAQYLEWRRHDNDRSGETVPFQTTFCSASCISRFFKRRTASSNDLMM